MEHFLPKAKKLEHQIIDVVASMNHLESEWNMHWYLWGLNPRRLECLADLKSAPLDHSGKIPTVL